MAGRVSCVYGLSVNIDLKPGFQFHGAVVGLDGDLLEPAGRGLRTKTWTKQIGSDFVYTPAGLGRQVYS
jgi:hypothetical protein